MTANTRSPAVAMTLATSVAVVAGVVMTVMGQSRLGSIALETGGRVQIPWLWFLSPYVPIALMAAVARRGGRAAIVVLVGTVAVALPAITMMAAILAVPAGSTPGHGALDAQFGLELGLLPVLQWFFAFVVAVVVGLVGLKKAQSVPGPRS